MELWYSEKHAEGIKFSLKIKSEIFAKQSDYQYVSILDTEDYGKLLTLDGLVMVTERDEFVYHEMITHVPLFAHPNPKKVLVIGGGDGGTVREVVRHDEVELVDMVEIDGVVVDACKKFMPTLSSELDNPKVKLHIMDGFEFLRNIGTKKEENKYDVILVDSTDPIGPGVVLTEQPFYKLCFDAMKDDGILVAQSESPFYNERWMKNIYVNLRKIFPKLWAYKAFIPTYPSGLWSFAFASKKYNPFDDFKADKVKIIENAFKYYNTDIHISAFKLPNFMRRIVNE